MMIHSARLRKLFTAVLSSAPVGGITREPRIFANEMGMYTQGHDGRSRLRPVFLENRSFRAGSAGGDVRQRRTVHSATQIHGGCGGRLQKDVQDLPCASFASRSS